MSEIDAFNLQLLFFVLVFGKIHMKQHFIVLKFSVYFTVLTILSTLNVEHGTVLTILLTLNVDMLPKEITFSLRF